MLNENTFSEKSWAEAIGLLKTEFPAAIWDTLYITLLSTLIAAAIALPLGMILAAGDKKLGVLRVPQPVLKALGFLINVLRSIPFLILLIIVLPLARLLIGTAVGNNSFVVSLVIAAFPFITRLFEASFRGVDPGVIEASQSMGASPFQIVTKVMLPEAFPSLISDLTIAVTTVLGYTAMSGAVGGTGLGMIAITYGYNRYRFLVMYFAVIVLIVLVQLFQTVGSALSKKADKRRKGNS